MDPNKVGVVLNIPLALVNAIGSVVAVFIIDKMGRRFIMLRTLPFILVACLLVSLSMYLTSFSKKDIFVEIGDYLAMVGLIMYLSFFSVGMSSPVWSVNTEIYPIHLIGSGSSLATSTNWFSNFLVSTFFLSILKSSDTGKVVAFGLLAMFSLLAYIFIYFLLPETGGKPINENIKNILGEKKYNKLIDRDMNNT